MVAGANKSGSRKRVFKKTTSKTKEIYIETKPKKPTCQICGRPLPGTAAGNKNTIKKLAKTKRRPSRPFGGQTCSPCTKNILRARARLSQE